MAKKIKNQEEREQEYKKRTEEREEAERNLKEAEQNGEPEKTLKVLRDCVTLAAYFEINAQLDLEGVKDRRFDFRKVYASPDV